MLKFSVLPENPQERDINDTYQYTLMKIKPEFGDNYQELVNTHLKNIADPINWTGS